MPIVDFQYEAGTQKVPQNTESTSAAWIETSRVHFPDNKLTPTPSESISSGASGSATLNGTCRAQWAGRLGGASDIAGAYYLFGTNAGLYAQYRATRYNITPFAGQTNDYLSDDPLTTVNASTTLLVDYTSHGLTVGDQVTIFGASDVGGIDADSDINGVNYLVSATPTIDSFTVEMAVSATSDETAGGTIVSVKASRFTAEIDNPIETLNGSATVTFNYTSHGLTSGDRVRLAGLATTGGIPLGELNAEHIITVVDVDSFTFTVSTSATVDVTGGGADVKIFTPMAAGNENQTFKSGFGAGLFGRGTFGTNRFSSTTPSFPRISSFDNFGNRFVYCAGDYDEGDGQKIYEWDGDRTLAPTPMIGAPTNCNWVAVVANQVVALCGTNIIIGLTDPATGLAQWPEIPSNSPFGDVIPVQRATRLLSVVSLGEKSAIVFAPEPLLLRLVGGVWDLIELGNEFPIVAPAAYCRFQDGIMWHGQDGNYYFCNGGAVRKMLNRQNGEYVRGNVNQAAIWTTFLMQDQKHDQFWHYYPAGSSLNPSEYVIYSPFSESYTTGEQIKTSAQRPNVIDAQFYTTDRSDIYTSFTTEATSFPWSAKSAFFYLDPERRFKVTRLWPDSVITGSVNVTIKGKDHAQDAEKNYGTYVIDPSTTSMTVRAAARLISLEFSGDQGFTLPNLKMKVQPMGTRRL